jgi:hypothetical protein
MVHNGLQILLDIKISFINYSSSSYPKSSRNYWFVSLDSKFTISDTFLLGTIIIYLYYCVKQCGYKKFLIQNIPILGKTKYFQC